MSTGLNRRLVGPCGTGDYRQGRIALRADVWPGPVNQIDTPNTLRLQRPWRWPMALPNTLRLLARRNCVQRWLAVERENGLSYDPQQIIVSSGGKHYAITS